MMSLWAMLVFTGVLVLILYYSLYVLLHEIIESFNNSDDN